MVIVSESRHAVALEHRESQAIGFIDEPSSLSSSHCSVLFSFFFF